MANTIAKATGFDKARIKEVSRLGSESSRGEANTWHTYATAFVRADGSGYIEVRRDGKPLHFFEFGPEK